MKRLRLLFVNVLDILSLTVFFILLAICAALLYFVVSNFISSKNNTTPYLSLYTIVSPSMEPNIHVYDVILSVKSKNFEIGDIITFYSDSIDTGGYTITHRIYDIYEVDGVTYYITKGDNNDSTDEGTITINNIVGKTLYIIPSLGKLQSFISSKNGFIMIILIPAILIVLIDIKEIVKVIIIRKKLVAMPNFKNVNAIEELEENKKLRALVDEAERVNEA